MTPLRFVKLFSINLCKKDVKKTISHTGKDATYRAIASMYLPPPISDLATLSRPASRQTKK